MQPLLPGNSTPPPPTPPADITLPPAPQPSPIPGGSIPKGGGKHKEKKKHSKKSVHVRVPLTGLSRPPKRMHGVSAESHLHQDDSQEDSGSDSDVNPRRHSRYQRHSSHRVVSDSDSEDSPGRHGGMSAFIEARIQEALSGAGYMKESVFQQAMVECQQDQSQRMAALEQRATNAGEDSFMNFFQSNYYVNICIICNISEIF